MGETLHTISVWYYQHPTGKTVEDLIDQYWEILNVEEDISLDQLVELFLTAVQISVLSLTEGIFYLADFEDVFNQSLSTITYSVLEQKINQVMEEKRNENV